MRWTSKAASSTIDMTEQGSKTQSKSKAKARQHIEMHPHISLDPAA
jgi:hypothetical protein